MTRFDRRAFTGLTLAAMAAPPALAAPKGDIVVPLRFERNLLSVPVTLGGRGPYPFQLATGHLFGIIDQTLAEELGLKRRPLPNMEARTVSGPVKYELFLVEDFVLAGAWKIGRTELVGRPFRSGAEARGIFPFTSYLQTTLDFLKPELHVHRGRVEPPDGAAKADLAQLSGPMREPPIVRADFGGKTLKLFVDTGDNRALTLYPDAVRRLGLWDRYPHRIERSFHDADGYSSDGRIVRGDDLDFAGQRFTRPVVTLMNPAHARQDKMGQDGVIGIDLLRRFRILFDPKRYSAWFSPNARLHDDFRYDRAGADVEDHVVTAVAPGSPAEKAGLALGDRLVAINGDSELPPHWAFSGPAGETLVIAVERDGARKDIPLVLEERL